VGSHQSEVASDRDTGGMERISRDGSKLLGGDSRRMMCTIDVTEEGSGWRLARSR